ncbi:hypothetical protein GCM10009527_095310 [Actinomadura nitritigenes]
MEVQRPDPQTVFRIPGGLDPLRARQPVAAAHRPHLADGGHQGPGGTQVPRSVVRAVRGDGSPQVYRVDEGQGVGQPSK